MVYSKSKQGTREKGSGNIGNKKSASWPESHNADNIVLNRSAHTYTV